MGVYIKGMEMPKDCIVCPFGWNGCNKQHDFVYMGSRPDFCPLGEVKKPHGRLVDGDKVLEIAMEWCPDDDGTVGKIGDLRDLLDEIEAMPTIIEAEEGD